ncbi:MAG: hypothetical protein ACFE75_09005 [Candidatus Hodarchaeota archaeon]
MLELKELLEEREDQKEERVQKLREEKLPDHVDKQLFKQKYELKRKNCKLIESLKRSELNPRYVEEYEQLLRLKECLRDYYQQPYF